ncbi:HET domain protein [Poronia punctata]|nr:HET domain protein [Poronia punctata]
MRLINTETFALEEFMGSGPADLEYAILSHTWEDEEVTFQDFVRPDNAYRNNMKGFGKIVKMCELARRDGIKYGWVDTCCIDKSSSAELTEAINSMFNWYRDAKVCYAWLGDLPGFSEEPIDSALKKCRWFTRGWTLQELLAPRHVEFYDRDWHLRGTKGELKDLIAEASKIGPEVLESPERLYDLPVAQRMSWAATRQTTRPEDIAYCLLGIFEVNMPLLYGEGERAFLRLQEEIAKETNDLSIFAWKVNNDDREGQKYHGVLASSPGEFRDCGSIRLIDDPMFGPEWSLGSKGLRIETDIITGMNGSYLFRLNCKKGPRGAPISIWLKDHGRGVYSREKAGEYGDLQQEAARPVDKKSIHIVKRLSPSKSRELEGSHRGAFIFRHNFNTGTEFPFPGFPFSASVVLPWQNWDPQRRMLHTQGLAEFSGMVYFTPRYESNGMGTDLNNAGEWFIVAFGRSQDELRPWITIHGKDDKYGLGLMEVGNKDIQRMGAMAREKIGKPLTTTIKTFKGAPWKNLSVSINPDKLEGETVFYIDIRSHEPARFLPKRQVRTGSF